MRHSLWLVAVATAAVLYGALPVNAAGPPHTLSHDLTAQGEVIWNLDALVKDTFGDQTVCWDGLHLNVFAVRGPGDALRQPPATRHTNSYFATRTAPHFAWFHARARRSLAQPLARFASTGATSPSDADASDKWPQQRELGRVRRRGVRGQPCLVRRSARR